MWSLSPSFPSVKNLVVYRQRKQSRLPKKFLSFTKPWKQIFSESVSQRLSWTFSCDFLKNSYFWEQILNFTNNNFTRCVRRMLWFFSEWLFFRTSLNVCSISFINHANQLQMQKSKSPPLLNWFQSDLINSNNFQT